MAYSLPNLFLIDDYRKHSVYGHFMKSEWNSSLVRTLSRGERALWLCCLSIDRRNQPKLRLLGSPRHRLITLPIRSLLFSAISREFLAGKKVPSERARAREEEEKHMLTDHPPAFPLSHRTLDLLLSCPLQSDLCLHLQACFISEATTHISADKL